MVPAVVTALGYCRLLFLTTDNSDSFWHPQSCRSCDCVQSKMCEQFEPFQQLKATPLITALEAWLLKKRTASRTPPSLPGRQQPAPATAPRSAAHPGTGRQATRTVWCQHSKGVSTKLTEHAGVCKGSCSFAGMRDNTRVALTRYTICHSPQSCIAATSAIARLSSRKVEAASLPLSVASFNVYHTTPAGPGVDQCVLAGGQTLFWCQGGIRLGSAPSAWQQAVSQQSLRSHMCACLPAKQGQVTTAQSVCTHTCQHHACPACLLEQHSHRTKVGGEQRRGRTGVVPQKLPQGEASRHRIEATCSGRTIPTNTMSAQIWQQHNPLP